YDLKCNKKNYPTFKIDPVQQNIPQHSSDDIVKNIDNLLNKDEVIGLSYNYEEVDDKDSRKGGHASLIVGRRLNKESGDCEYLVRNSWGKDCPQHEGEGVTCHKICDAYGNKCRNSGHFWVNQRKLKNAMTGITYLP
ncbi:MAG: hypothetical protein Q7U04_10625, partial [Bacteriovorax sp.]|nr:hypothetical protein [Bacteriovorax sp.]